MKIKNNVLILSITFLSGFSFLIYEVSWNRFLSLILGTTVTASTIVLSAFMTGFGLGALIISNYANQTKNQGKFLAYLLAGIGLFSLFNFFIIDKGLQSFYGFFSNKFAADLIFYISTFILLTIPAFFMGGIIPMVSKILVSENNYSEEKISTIYTFETLGSTIGGLITGFFLLGYFGEIQTIFIAVSINLLIALFLFISKKYSNFEKINVNESKKIKPEINSLISEKIANISTFFFGFTILGLQIIWLRIFKTYFTNTSYTFTLITTSVILGISLGSWIFRKKSNKILSKEKTIIHAISLLGILSLFGFIILIFLPELLLFPFENLIENPYFRILVIPIISSLLIVLPPSIVSGFAFPLACNLYSNNSENISKNIGKILSFNTIGSVAGPITATFILIPIIGAGKSIIFLTILLSFLIIYISKLIKSEKKISKNINISKYKNSVIGISIILFLFILLTDKTQFLPPSVKKYDKNILSYDEKLEGTVIVTDEKEKGLFGKSTFVNNSAVIGSNYDAIKAVKMVGHIPFFAGLKCEKVLIIGFGIGVTTSAIASHEEVKNIDCIELVPDIVQFAKYYETFNKSVYNDKRLNVISGDGRHFLQITSNNYDLISCDPTHPVLGSGNLYTKEYFEQCYNHLNNNGMVSQYLPLHKLRLNDLLGIIKTFNLVFPNSSVWLGQYHAILLGKKGDGKIDFETWKTNVMNMPKDNYFYLEPYHIAANVIFDNEQIKNFPSNIRINTDNLNYTEFFSFSSFDGENIYNNLKYFSENRCNIDNIFKNIDDKVKMDKFISGNKKLTESLYFSLKGDKENAINSLREACRVNPESQEFPFLLKFYYSAEK